MKKMETNLTDLKMESFKKHNPTIMIGTKDSEITYIGVIDVLDTLGEKIKNSNDYEEAKEWFELYMRLLILLKESDEQCQN